MIDRTNRRESRDRAVFSTERLVIRLATTDDAEMYLRLWTDPRVMTNVGFPKGLPITIGEIHDSLAKAGNSEFDRLLVVELRSDHWVIGECKMGRSNSEGIATTDVRLLPEFWGRGYGVETKRGLLNHMFTSTDCLAVEATPSVNNAASIRMQEAVGAICAGESVYLFPEEMRSYTVSVHHYIYRVSKEDWKRARNIL